MRNLCWWSLLRYRCDKCLEPRRWGVPLLTMVLIRYVTTMLEYPVRNIVYTGRGFLYRRWHVMYLIFIGYGSRMHIVVLCNTSKMAKLIRIIVWVCGNASKN